jgi:hypothetical protein
MARDYLLAAQADFGTEDVETAVWAALDQQHALEMITAKVEISKQFADHTPDDFHAAAAILTVQLASQKVYEHDKFMAMASLAIGLLHELVTETGKTAHEVLVSLPLI